MYLAYPVPAAWNVLQFRHGASQGREPTGTFSFDKSFESFTNQRGLFRHTGKFLRDANKVVVEGKGCSHDINYSII